MKFINYGMRLARALWENRTLRATAAFALSGMAFALGNLLMARTMPINDFGRVALEIALLNLFSVIAPLGLDQVLLRRQDDASVGLFGRVLLVNGVVAFAVGFASNRFYHLPPFEAGMMAVAIVAGGVSCVASAGMRAQNRDGMPLVMVFGTNSLILLCGIEGFLSGTVSVDQVLAVVAIGNLIISSIAWIIFPLGNRAPRTPSAPIRWTESISLLGLVAVGALAIQLERLIIPKTLDSEALAIFAVLSSVATFPFRLVTSGAGFSLAPQLRLAETFQERKLVVVRELSTIGVLLSITTGVIALFAPLVTSLITGGRYELSEALVLAACLSGAVKVIQSLIRTVVIGCGSHRAIVTLNGIGWAAIVVSILAGIVGARWDLTGLITGMAVGSLICNLPALAIAIRSMRSTRVVVDATGL
jgi:O-antigen/teichoic acid export membrane protein